MHDRPGMSLFYDGLEGGEIDLAQGALIDHRIAPEALKFLVIAGEMFERCAYSLALNSFHIADCHPASQVWIFCISLEVPATQRRADDVNAGTQDNIASHGVSFLSQSPSDF